MVKIYKTPFADSGDKRAIPVTTDPQGFVSDETGFTGRYELADQDPQYLPIEREEMNGILNEITEALGDIQLSGVAKWSADAAPYPTGAVVWHDNAAWISTVGNNSSEPGTGSWIAAVAGHSFIKPLARRGKPLFVKTAPAEFIIPEGFSAVIDGITFIASADIPLSLDNDLDTGTKEAGSDYFVHIPESGSPFISLQGTVVGAALIGGFHYGLTGHSESATGNKTEADMVKLRGINAHTFWDLTFRANKWTNRGLTFDGINWIDIYLADDEYAVRGWSKAGGWIAAGGTDYGRKFPIIPEMFGGNGSATYGKLTPFVAWDMLNAAGMEPISYKQFAHAMYGVEEGLPALGIETVTGKIEHYPRLTSRYGVEQATGVQWIWGADLGTSSSGTLNNIADSRGQVYSDVIVSSLGGARGDTAGHPGSRGSSWNNGLASSNWDAGVRGLRDHLTLD